MKTNSYERAEFDIAITRAEAKGHRFGRNPTMQQGKRKQPPHWSATCHACKRSVIVFPVDFASGIASLPQIGSAGQSACS